MAQNGEDLPHKFCPPATAGQLSAEPKPNPPMEEWTDEQKAVWEAMQANPASDISTRGFDSYAKCVKFENMWDAEGNRLEYNKWYMFAEGDQSDKMVTNGKNWRQIKNMFWWDKYALRFKFSKINEHAVRIHNMEHGQYLASNHPRDVKMSSLNWDSDWCFIEAGPSPVKKRPMYWFRGMTTRIIGSGPSNPGVPIYEYKDVIMDQDWEWATAVSLIGESNGSYPLCFVPYRP